MVQALYIHIPFCTNKCYYCDFNSVVLKGQPVDEYLTALDQEMAATVRSVPQQQPLSTVFVGGGTPTTLNPQQMQRFLASVRNHFHLADDVEFSMEANPGTVDAEKLSVMLQGGVNRLSFGVQSFDNGLLERIGRIHNTDDVFRSLEQARSVGFRNVSIDLMFGLPGQTLDQLTASVRTALGLDLTHYSLYGLKVEENTLFHTLYERNELPLPAEEEELAMYMALIEQLERAGYRQYEISNFARPGFESRHNMTYWLNEPYYGVGAGAHGYVDRQRHVNIKGVTPYMEKAEQVGLPRLEVSTVSEQEAMEDFMMVGLRMLSGVSNNRFSKQFTGRLMEDVFGDLLAKLVATDMLEHEPLAAGGTYRLTSRSLPVGNEVFGAFLSL